MQTKGDPMYNEGISATPVTAAVVNGNKTTTAYNVSGSGTPGVVTIDQLNQRAGFIETGPFDVRIILTEEPKGGLTTDMILVEGGGKATKVTKGVSLRGALTVLENVQAVRKSELTTAIATYYNVGTQTPPVPTAATDPTLPEATGRDNMYYQYFVTIAPGSGGSVVISPYPLIYLRIT